MDLFQWFVCGAILICFFQGKGSAGVFIAILALVPLLRLAFAHSYRVRIRSLLKQNWQSLENYSKEHLRLPLKAIFIFAVIPTLFLNLVNGGSITTMDNVPLMLTASSLVTEGTTNLIHFTDVGPTRRCGSGDWPYYLRCTRTGVHSSYPLGGLVFAVPVTLVSRLLGANVRDGKIQWRLSKWAGAWVGGLSIGIFFLLALQLAAVKPALAISLILASASSMLSIIGQGLWSHDGVIFWFLVAMLMEFLYADRFYSLAITVEGICLSLMVADRLTSATLILPFAIWVFLRSWKRACWIGLVALISFSPWAIYFYRTYGAVLGPQQVQAGVLTHSVPQLKMGLANVLFSPSHGLFVYQPWLLLLLALPFLHKKNTSIKGWRTFFGAAITLQVLLIASWPVWYGGHSWGSRLLAEVPPLGALLLAEPIARLWKSTKGRWLVLSLGILGFLMQANYVFAVGGFWMDDPPPNCRKSTDERFWDWSDPPFLYPFFRKPVPGKTPPSRQ